MDITKEAIAEARAVKSLAEQTAVDFLKEHFMADAKGLISKKLKEEEEEDEEISSTTSQENLPDESLETPPAETAEVEEEEEDLDLDEVLRELDSEDEITSESTEEDEVVEESDEEMVSDDELDEILREMESEDEDEDDNDSEYMKTEVKKLKKQLESANKTILAQRKTINEVGLLSAKLLFSNRILGKFNLSESRKIKVLETFDRVTTLREAKLVYSTIVESLDNFKSSKIAKTLKLEEGASRPIKSISKMDNTNGIILKETQNSILNKVRLQELAGINKQ